MRIDWLIIHKDDGLNHPDSYINHGDEEAFNSFNPPVNFIKVQVTPEQLDELTDSWSDDDKIFVKKWNDTINGIDNISNSTKALILQKRNTPRKRVRKRQDGKFDKIMYTNKRAINWDGATIIDNEGD